VIITELPTPQVLVDERRARRNIERMQAAAAARGIRLRPHAKTHKSPLMAGWQLDAGAVGICCAKIGEAEVFVDAGVHDIRLPYPVHPSNASRLLALMDKARLSIIVDDLDVAAGWSDAMVRAGRTLNVLAKIDVGFHRCGIDPTAVDAVAFLRRLAALPGLWLSGLLSHAGHAYGAGSAEELSRIARDEAAMHESVRAAAEAAGVPIGEVSVGATPTARFSVKEPVVRELRPGNYVYFDRTQVGLEAAAIADCALTVMATIVSKPAADRLVLDCGSKTLSADPARGFGPAIGYGLVFRDLEAPAPDESLAIERLSEEHAVVRVTGSTPLRVGDRVRVLPNHSCVVSNLVDAIRLVEGLTVLDTVPVAARGRIT
jgi:D-serine deaminase-like pyridoxal phosphate-dependent protein